MKPRFDRSYPTFIQGSKPGTFAGRITHTQAETWKLVSHDTLGLLAAKGKVGVHQVCQRLNNKPTRKFVMGFLNAMDLQNPTPRDMKQIGLFNHLLCIFRSSHG